MRNIMKICIINTCDIRVNTCPIIIDYVHKCTYVYYKFIQRYDDAHRFMRYNAYQILFTWINVQDA